MASLQTLMAGDLRRNYTNCCDSVAADAALNRIKQINKLD